MQEIKTCSLFILSCGFSRISDALTELSDLMQENDILLLLDDAVHGLNFPHIQRFANIKILDQDAYLVPNNCFAHIDSISYIQFAQLIEQSTKVHSWK